MRAACRALLLALGLLLAALPAPAADVPFQRMVLAPGCYVLEPHAFTDVSAFCLDEELPAPGHGVLLASVPDALGDTFLRLKGQKLGLQAALEQHLIRMEGLGGQNYFHVRIRNLSSARIEICINAPTVVAGDSGYPTADLAKIYGEIVRVLPHASDAEHSKGKDSDNEELETEVRLQKKLWDVTEKARNEAADHAEDPIPASPSAADRPAVARQKDCTAKTDTAVVCSE
jgi:hypothetical protein